MPTEREQAKTFQEWLATVPSAIKDEPLWSAHFYQRALYLYDLCWLDCEVLMRDGRGRAIAEQIIRSCGSISANMEEGYGRGFGLDYARFLKIALGSTRETKGWYFRSRYLLSQAVVDQRLLLCKEIVSLLIPVIQSQRTFKG